MKYHITNAGFILPDVDKAAPFYRDHFGYSIKQDFLPEFVEFEAETGATLFLWQWSHLEQHLGKEAMSKVKHHFMAAVKFDTPEEVDQAYQELEALGVEFIAKPTDWEWKARAAYFVDGEGYVWELYAWI